MTTTGDEGSAQMRSPGDWPSKPEREYARRQAALAAHHGVDVESRVFETDSAGSVHTLVAGDPDAEPVILLHGVSTTAATWIPLLPALTDEYRVYVPDRPGRGLSAAPSYHGRDLRDFMTAYLVELCEGLGLDRPHVVANSLGGLQAFLLTIDRDCVDRLCLVGGPAGIDPDIPLLFRLLTIRVVNRPVFWLMRRGDPLENARDQMARINVVDDSAVSDGFYEMVAAADDLPGRFESLRSLALEEGSIRGMHPIFDLRDEIEEITRPTAFVWGTEDWFWPPATGRPVAAAMADAEFHELRDHGHMPWMEPGNAVAERIRSFLDRGADERD